MANPDLSSAYGTIDWVNGENNWRAEDAEHLQKRGINRYEEQGDFESTTPEIGSVAFIDDDNYLVAKTAGSEFRRVMFSNYLRADTESSTSVSLQLAGGTAKVQLQSSTISITDGTFTAHRLSSNSDGTVTVAASDGQTTSITRATGADGKLAFSKGLKIDAGGIEVTAGGASITGAVSITGSLNMGTGNITTSGTLAVNSPGTITGNLTGNVTGTVTAISGVSRLGNFSFQNFQLTKDSHADNGIEFKTGTEDGIRLFSGTSGTLKINDGSTNDALIAGIVISDSATPPTGSYPEGTLWVQTA
jgi:hypothetical protein